MVAYSFKREFIEPIRAGTKFQTIRADRRRHARPGETLQLYHGMRTRGCVLIGLACCILAEPIRLHLAAGRVEVGNHTYYASTRELAAFATADGFADWPALRRFWRDNHPGLDPFSGVLIRWGALEP